MTKRLPRVNDKMMSAPENICISPKARQQGCRQRKRIPVNPNRSAIADEPVTNQSAPLSKATKPYAKRK
jgi:hypothetical protein